MPTNTLLCSLRGVRMNYGAGDVLKGLDLDLPAGQITALLGINGAGKSTLLQILAGVVSSSAGVVMRNCAVAMVYQELSLLPELSVAENLALPRLSSFRRWGRLHWKLMFENAARSLSRVGLPLLDPRTAVGSLSTGERQLVEIARALDSLEIDGKQGPSLLILDEPTSALSQRECDRLFTILRELVRSSGTGILFVSHRLDEVRTLCDQIVVLRDGLIAGQLDNRGAGQNMTSDHIVALMTGETSFKAAADSSENRSRADRRSGNQTSVLERRAVDKAAALECRGADRATSLSLRDLYVTDAIHKQLLLTVPKLDVPAGTSVAIAGLLGSGRSLLLRSLAASLPAATGGARAPRGDLRIRGKIQGASMAYLHEDRGKAGLFPDLDALENLSIGERSRDRRRHAPTIFARLGVRSTRGAKPLDAAFERAGALSGGNQQKLLIGRALVSGAKLLLLDEPTRGVDARARAEIHGLIETFCATGGAVLWVSSDFDELASHSDLVYIITRGSLECTPFAAVSGTALTAEVLSREASHRAHPSSQSSLEQEFLVC